MNTNAYCKAFVYYSAEHYYANIVVRRKLIVPDPGKGVCTDPVNRDAILEGGGPGPPDGNKERQLNPDKGRERT
jgi:hypothetical protein